MATLFLMIGFAVPIKIYAQGTTYIPGEQKSPWQQNIRGFMAFRPGITAIPEISIRMGNVSGYVNKVESAMPRVPGFAIGIGIIPLVGMNGIGVEVDYVLESAFFKHRSTQTVINKPSQEGNDSLGITFISLCPAYYRYFLEGSTHIYILSSAGPDFQSIEYRMKGEKKEYSGRAQRTNVDVSAGVGCVYDYHGGSVGGELRGQFPLLTTSLKAKTDYGPADIEFYVPTIIKLQFTWYLGNF